MAESEKIRGIRITSMFEELRQRKTLLKLILVDTDFEHLAVVTGLRRKESGSHFIIDTPRGFKEAAADIDIWQIRFEFIISIMSSQPSADKLQAIRFILNCLKKWSASNVENFSGSMRRPRQNFASAYRAAAMNFKSLI
jgi:hypothetical protein